MILLHIITNSDSQAVEIADYLLKKKLILNALVLKKGTLREFNNDTNKVVARQQHLLTGQSKALLFNTIDKKLREKYPDDLPIIYSVPIVSMDWEQADNLIASTAKV